MSTTSISSGLLVGGGTLLRTGKSMLNSVQLIGDGTNAPTVTVYDNTTSAGLVLAQVKGMATTLFVDFTPAFALRADTGLFIQVSGVGATAIIGFDAT